MKNKKCSIGSKKIYRCFYDWDDHAVWASFDGKNIEILHAYSLDGVPMGSMEPMVRGPLGGFIAASRGSEREMLEHILKNELGITVTEQDYKFSEIKGYAEAHELPFSKEDITSADGRQYKIFNDRRGNWSAFASRAMSNGRKRIISQHHIDLFEGINRAYEEFLSKRGVDIKQLARYTEGEEGRLHVPTKEDFEKYFEIRWDDDGNISVQGRE